MRCRVRGFFKGFYLKGKENGEEEKIASDYVLLATGSQPRSLPNLEFDNNFIITFK